ncbi:hypothetical protein BV25DRAFT_1922331 [Artomyces pyxidatus]|uniref:Uncharacterized protein n=1 Tax=Artomyces pyxidatus TaxID=48021 RepID=A0ACB8SG16_9AGAM|nr:hypothetical protein BV25DRAFT_1922331 [Artomyces pyxidatus]
MSQRPRVSGDIQDHVRRHLQLEDFERLFELFVYQHFARDPFFSDENVAHSLRRPSVVREPLEAVFDDSSKFFKRDPPPRTNSGSGLQLTPAVTSASGVPPGQFELALNADVIADIVAATRAMPSWKACIAENTSWTEDSTPR